MGGLIALPYPILIIRGEIKIITFVSELSITKG
jgi:hypothetical protein